VEQNKPMLDLDKAALEGRFEEEGWRVRKDGSRFGQTWCSPPCTIRQGKLVGFSKLVRDVTEQKHAREQWRHRSGSSFSIECLGSHIAILDSSGTILEVNRAWRDFGRPHLRMEAFGVGANYLSICDQAHGQQEEYARRQRLESGLLRAANGIILPGVCLPFNNGGSLVHPAGEPI